MALLPLYLVPEPVLRQVAKPVETVTPDILRLLDDMLETMYAAEGVGLAAPQVGLSIRVIVMDVHAGKDDRAPLPMKMINPEIIAESEEMSAYEEGCLSIPQVNAEVVRPANVRVRYMGTDGAMHEIDATGLLATCVQHEIDHLDGRLFIDYLSPLKRNMLMRRYNKRQKSG